jgi:hypothetical protein
MHLVVVKIFLVGLQMSNPLWQNWRKVIIC